MGGGTAPAMRYPYRIAGAVCLRKNPALLRKKLCGRVAAFLLGFSAKVREMSATRSSPPETGRRIGTPADAGPRQWVQTDRAAHEAWGRLAVRVPRAAALLHHLIANMGHQNAVVIPQKVLAKIMGCSVDTIQRSVAELVKEQWIQVIQIGPRGTVNAYVVNAAVAWGEKREHIGRLAVFHARVMADAEDQPEGALERRNLRRIPALYPGEEQLPTGEGEDPPSQPALPGMEPDLPARQMDIEDYTG